MIVAIASDDGMNVAEHPDRCSGFVIFEVGTSNVVRVGYRSACTQNGSRFSVPERAAAPPSADTSLMAALSGCDAVISRKMNAGLIRDLRGSAIGAYGCNEGGVDDAAQLFAQGRLQKLAEPFRACQ
jgi:predicted Fe-Mo cluster-binding NifX family protein